MSLRSIVRLFERVGASCRKLRGRNVYECWKGDVVARITPELITVRSIGELRLEYSDFAPRGYLIEESFFRDLREVTGARSAYLDFPGSYSADIVLEFGLDEAERAVEAFRKMAEHGMWGAATNIHGELMLYKDEEAVDAKEWLKTFEED